MRSMVPLSVETDPWRALLSRNDIRMVDGILHVIDDSSTPADAERDDLLTVAAAIEAAGIAVLLVRDANRRPKLVVDTTHADAALAALRDPDLGPVYLKARGEDPVPAHSVTPSRNAVEAYAVFRPRGPSRHRARARGPAARSPSPTWTSSRSSATGDAGGRSPGCSTRTRTSSPKTSTWSSHGSTGPRASSSGSVRHE